MMVAPRMRSSCSTRIVDYSERGALLIVRTSLTVVVRDFDVVHDGAAIAFAGFRVGNALELNRWRVGKRFVTAFDLPGKHESERARQRRQ